jgi:hypothetical protein
LQLIRAPVGRYFCPVALPWFRFRRSDSPVNRLRRSAYAFNEGTARRRLPLRTLRYLVAWPFVVIRRAAAATKTSGPQVVAEGGPGRWQQFAAMVGLGLANNITPKSYYLFQLWRPEQRFRADSYVQDFEGRWILNAINQGKDLAVVDDKTRFAEFCARHDLATVPILAEFGPGGSETWAIAPGVLPRSDLFVKQSAATAVAGAGAECWSYENARDTWRRAPEDLGEQALVERLRQLGYRARIVLQQRLRNHEQVACFSLKALCTVRVVTLKTAGRPAEHFRSCLRMPLGDAEVDHPVHGGLAAPLLPRGVLGAAVGNRVGSSYENHPATAARIAGSTLPFFDDAVTLAVRAHELAGISAAIGWDIAITPSGPLLLEGNSVWGTDVMQTSFRQPLGDTDIIGDLQRLMDEQADHQGPRFRKGSAPASS